MPTASEETPATSVEAPESTETDPAEAAPEEAPAADESPDGLSEAEETALESHKSFDPVESVGDLDDTAPATREYYTAALNAGKRAGVGGATAAQIARTVLTVLKYGAKAV